MGTGTNSTRRVAGRGFDAVSAGQIGQIGLIDANANGAFAVSRDILVSVWRHPPTVAEAERLCEVLNGVVRNAQVAGLWVITTPSCEIPSVPVRRLMALQLRELTKLRAFAVSVEALDAEGSLMRAAIRSTAVAGGFRSAHIGPDVASVALHLSRVFPALPTNWGERVVRILSHICDEVAGGELTRVHYVPASLRAEPNA